MSARFRVLLTDRAWPDTSIERQVLSAIDAEIVEPESHGEAELLRLAVDVDAIGTNWAQVTEPIIQASPRCKVISRFGIGIDNIAVDAATQRGIPVTNCPDYCVDEVSDHALGLLLACARRIGFFHWRTKHGEYDLSASPPMFRVSGQTLGLVGLGKIARTLLPKARALGMRIQAYTPSQNDHGTGINMVSFDELLQSSDFISIHAPLTPQSRHLFDANAFAKMRRTAFLINTSRGGFIDHESLLNAIQQGQIAGAALDVFEPEPPDLTLPLYRDERVIVTPHAAFVSVESLQQLRRQAMENVVTVLQGGRPQNVINPQIYSD